MVILYHNILKGRSSINIWTKWETRMRSLYSLKDFELMKFLSGGEYCGHRQYSLKGKRVGYLDTYFLALWILSILFIAVKKSHLNTNIDADAQRNSIECNTHQLSHEIKT